MTPQEFYNNVVKLREYQKTFLKTHTSASISACRRQEKLIDDEIKRVNGILEAKSKQPGATLFNQPQK